MNILKRNKRENDFAIQRQKVRTKMDEDIRKCPICHKQVLRQDMDFTRDCHGITFRLVCFKCYPKLMAKGYDGEYYTEADECLTFDY